MIDILMFIPPQAQLSISFDDYKRFLEIAKQEEQLRIIELLENLAYLDDDGDELISESKKELIELIKGENK